MFVFGHLGIGHKLASPWVGKSRRAALSHRWVLFGTLFPDLLDKAIYYIYSWSTHRRGAELGLISGTRTFGHTAVFLLGLSIIAFLKRSKLLVALSVGIATHLVLDNWADYIHNYSTIEALLFPFLGFRFPIIPFENVGDHLHSFLSPFFFATEGAGIFLLCWDYWRYRVGFVRLKHPN